MHRNGSREAVAIERGVVGDYAQAQASTKAFGKGPDRPVTFEAALAKEDVMKADKKKAS